VRQSRLSCYAIELKVFMRVVPHIAIVRTVEPLARIGDSALEVSVWRRVFTFCRCTSSWSEPDRIRRVASFAADSV
jgi:hypothetical protein